MATPTPPPNDPTPPRASLLSRPAEIKAFIVRLARWQDFAYAERLAAVEPGAKAVDVMVETKWLGRSANPLYHVNKELSVLAAVSLFEVIKASRCSEPFFKFRSHVFSRHIREIDFDKDTTAHDAIVALSCLTLVAPPHLTRLSITPSSAEHLLHALFHPLSNVDFSDEAVCVVESFRLLATRIIDLTLVNFTAQEAEVLLPLFLHLQSLRFTGQTTFSDDMDVLSRALAGLALRSLDCCLRSGTEPYGTTPEWVTSPWASVGTLSHLRIFTGELEADPWAFIGRFVGTLKTLDLACEEFSADHPPLLAIQFPQLTPLTLRTPFPAATSLLSLLATSPLLTLHLSLFDDEEIQERCWSIRRGSSRCR